MNRFLKTVLVMLFLARFQSPAQTSKTAATPFQNARLKKGEHHISPVVIVGGRLTAEGMWIPESSDPAKALVFPEQVKITCIREEATCHEIKAVLGVLRTMVELMSPDETDWPIQKWDETGLLASDGPDTVGPLSDRCHIHALSITFASGAVSTSDIPTRTKECETFRETNSYRLVSGNYYVDTTPNNGLNPPHSNSGQRR